MEIANSYQLFKADIDMIFTFLKMSYELLDTNLYSKNMSFALFMIKFRKLKSSFFISKQLEKYNKINITNLSKLTLKSKYSNTILMVFIY